jgi:ABC-type transport system involved in cytochrome c biogenesis ATPase subunit
MPSESTPTTSGLSLLIEWANGQDNWARAVAAEVIESRKPLTDGQLDGFYDILLREKELSPEVLQGVPMLTGATNGTPAEEALVLETLSDVQNVNALATNQTIAFNPRMTVLFGENGTGKTGYVRILKTAAAVRAAEPILRNINQPPGAFGPQAAIEYRIGQAAKQPLAWNGESGLPPLTRIDIFDSRGFLLHVDQELTYTYTPSELALFRYVHEGIEQLKRRLEQARERTTPKGNPFIARFSRDTTVFAKIESLGPSSDLTQIDSLAVVTKEEEAGLQALRERVEALRSTSTDARLQVANAERDLLRSLLHAVQAAEGFNATVYAEKLAAFRDAEARYKHATEAAFAGENVPAVLSDAWREFIEAGERYIQQIGQEDFPKAGDPCSYCRQPLGNAAVSLVKKYRDYCNNVLRKNAETARVAVEAIASNFRALDLSRLSQDIEKKRATFQAGTTIPPAFESGARFVSRALLLQASLKSMEPFTDPELTATAADSRKHGEARLADILRTAEELAQQATSRKQALEQESAKLRNLEARITLRELLPSVKTHIEAAKWADRAGTIAARISRTVGKTLTDASKVASEQLLNQDFEKHFIAECEALRAPKVSLDFPGRKGQPARRKLLPANHKLSDVLSEGEQKVIALADFIAEALLRKRATPVVFDDPVTSLDYKRLQHVVARLVQMSKTRQVIVFTHNIWFTMELLGCFDDEKDACSYYDVSDAGGQRGLISGGSHRRADTVKTLRGKINTLIQDAGAATAADTRDALVEKAYEVLRGVCEVIVESELLQGVTQRYQPNVMMTKLPNIRADRLQPAIEAILPVFEKACRYIASHSQPLETLNVRPTLDELRADWKNVQDARDAYMKD